MSKLQHQNIVTLFDYVSNDDGLFLIMEYVEGIELDQYMKDLGKPIDEALAIEFTKQIVSACNHAHERGVVHRDIKPPNVMITSDGNVKILDFGIAKMMDDEVNNLTKTGTQLGTVYYMSPEQVKGEDITPATDIYAIGVTLYQMVTGVKPYSDLTTEYQIYDKIVKEELPDPRNYVPELSEYITKVIRKSTQKEVNKRFLNCTDYLTVLKDQHSYRERFTNQKSEGIIDYMNNKPQSKVNTNEPATSSDIPIMNIPNSVGSMVCGIIGLLLSWNLIGVILNIIAVSQAASGLSKYNKTPDKYTQSSYSMIKAGKTLGIIGLCIFGLVLINVLSRL